MNEDKYRKDGGPAFPRIDVTGPENQSLWEGGHPGMTLRDYIAIDVLNGMICSAPVATDRTTIDKSVWAGVAYEWADAMLKARF